MRGFDWRMVLMQAGKYSGTWLPGLEDKEFEKFESRT